MKILLYNCMDLDDRNNRGGGVSIYVKNLVDALEQRDDIELYHLSAGRHFNHLINHAYIKEIENTYSEKTRVFRLYNSPIVSPANLAYNQIQTYLEDDSLNQVIDEFLIQQGSFDVVHFHNLEGLTLSVLRLKEKYPNTKFIYSLHNYFPLCPQVNLWCDQNCNCGAKDTGECCTLCKPLDVITDKVKLKLSLNEMIDVSNNITETTKLKKELDLVEDKYKDYEFPFEREGLIPFFEQYRKKNTEYINKYMDKVLAVSERTAYVANKGGISKDIIEVSYIGTKVADVQGKYKHEYRTDKPLEILYMGQMREDKGFYFFVDALETMDEELAQQIGVTVAARFKDMDAVERLHKLESKFSSMKLIDGYNHDELPEMLANIDVGVVPVLWEDNLPQVAIEMVAYGVAVLASDLGGAQELCEDERFCFKAGDWKSYQNCLARLFDKNWHEDYWIKVKKLVDMKNHLIELLGIYKEENEL